MLLQMSMEGSGILSQSSMYPAQDVAGKDEWVKTHVPRYDYIQAVQCVCVRDHSKRRTLSREGCAALISSCQGSVRYMQVE